MTRVISPEELYSIPARIRALYGQPGFETWDQIGDFFGVPRGTAWSIAYRLVVPPPGMEEQLRLAELRKLLPAMTAAIANYLGRHDVRPTIFSRHIAHHILAERRRLVAQVRKEKL